MKKISIIGTSGIGKSALNPIDSMSNIHHDIGGFPVNYSQEKTITLVVAKGKPVTHSVLNYVNGKFVLAGEPLEKTYKRKRNRAGK